MTGTKVNKKKSRKKVREWRRPSLFLGLLNRFTAFVYSLFINSFPGRLVSGSDAYFEKSAVGRLLSRGYLSGRRKNNKRSMTEAISQSFVVRTALRVRIAMITLSVNVYGLFFSVYGVVSVLAYYASLFVRGSYAHGIWGPITGGIIAVCTMPLLASSSSSAELIRKSKFWRRIVVDFLGIPEEKLKYDRSIGGTPHMLSAALAGLVFGALSYFLHPIVLPAAMFAVMIVCVISSCPEAGMVLTVSTMPLFQYIDHSDVMLVVLILVTLLSYIVKIKKRKRVRIITPEGILVLLYCVSLFISGVFTAGGWRTFADSALSVLVISGGYFLAFNLINSEKKLRSCIGVLSVWLVIFSVIGIWNTYYGYVSDGIMYSVGDRFGALISQNPIYLADSARVFGLFAVMMTPCLMAYCFKRKHIYGAVSTVLCIVSVLVGMALFGTAEALVALVIGIALYLIFYSHKTLTALAIIAIPVAAFVVIYPYIARRYGLEPTILGAIGAIFPKASDDAALRVQVFGDVIEMLKDRGLTGIGSGDYAFAINFAEYSNAVSESATDAGSLYLSVLCRSGILGSVIFALFILLLLRNGFRYVMKAPRNSHRAFTLALLCGIISALLFGMVNVLWSDIELLYFFWTCAGLLSACVRVGKEDAERKDAFYTEAPDETEIKLHV